MASQFCLQESQKIWQFLEYRRTLSRNDNFLGMESLCGCVSEDSVWSKGLSKFTIYGLLHSLIWKSFKLRWLVLNFPKLKSENLTRKDTFAIPRNCEYRTNPPPGVWTYWIVIAQLRPPPARPPPSAPLTPSIQPLRLQQPRFRHNFLSPPKKRRRWGWVRTKILGYHPDAKGDKHKPWRGSNWSRQSRSWFNEI